MLPLEVVCGAVLLGVLLLLALALRRRLLQRRGGTIELSMRVRAPRDGRGWAFGVGRFCGDDLQFYRVFSMAPRPRRSLSRRDLSVLRRREPVGGERLALLQDAVVLECCSPAVGHLELAMNDSAATGFLAWLEAQPPGARPLPRPPAPRPPAG